MQKFKDIKTEHGFKIKTFDIFNQKTTKDKIYNVKLDDDLPEMDSVKDFSTWMVDQIPLKQKIKMIEDIKKL